MDREVDDWTVPTPGQRVFADSLGKTYGDAFLMTLADGTEAVATLHAGGTVLLSGAGDGALLRPPLPVAATWGPLGHLTVRRDGAGHPQLEVATGEAEWDEPVRLVWNPSTGARVHEPDIGTVDPAPVRADAPSRYREAQPSKVRVLVALSGGRVASGHEGRPGILIWDVASGRRIAAIATGHVNRVSSLAAVPGPGGVELLVSADYLGGTLEWWNASTGAPVQTVEAHDRGVNDLCPLRLPDGRTLLASAGNDHTVRLWDPVTTTLAGEVTVPGLVYRVTAIPGTSMVATAQSDIRGVQRWDALTGARVGDPLETNGGVEEAVAVVRGPGGRPLIAAAGSQDYSCVRLWDAETGEPIGVTTGGPEEASTTVDLVAVSTLTGDRLARSATSGWITLWDPATLTRVGRTLRGHTQGDPYNILVHLLPWPTPAGTALLSGGCDGTIRYWPPQLLGAV